MMEKRFCNLVNNQIEITLMNIGDRHRTTPPPAWSSVVQRNASTAPVPMYCGGGQHYQLDGYYMEGRIETVISR